MNPINGSIGISWYRAEDYDRARAVMDDPQVFHDTFQDWHKAASDGVAKLKGQGFVVHKAYIDPVAFPKWCTDRRMKIDAKARMNFASEVAAAEDRRQN
jgi:hypothetical protein